MHKQQTYEDVLEPVIMTKEIFNGIRKFAWSQVPKRRYVSLLFDIFPAQDINPDIKPGADNPSHVVIFAIAAINDDAFQPIGHVFLHEETPAYKLSNCIERYIADLLLCELIVMNTICPPSSYLRTAVENLVGVDKMKNKTEAYAFTVLGSHVYHLYDPGSMLAEVRKEFMKAPISFRQYNINFTAYYEDVKKIITHQTEDDILNAVKLFSMTSYRKVIDKMADDALSNGSAEICAFFDILFDTFYGDSASTHRNRMSLTSSSVHESQWENSLSVLKSMSFIKGSKSEPEEIKQEPKNNDAIDTVRDIINMVASGTLDETTRPPHKKCSNHDEDNKPKKKKYKKKQTKRTGTTLCDNNCENNDSTNTHHCDFNDPSDVFESQNNLLYLENALDGTGCDANLLELNESLNVSNAEELAKRKKIQVMYAAKKMINIIDSVSSPNCDESCMSHSIASSNKGDVIIDSRIEKSDWMGMVLEKYKPIPHEPIDETSLKKRDKSSATCSVPIQNAEKESKEIVESNLTASDILSTTADEVNTSMASQNNLYSPTKNMLIPKHNEISSTTNEQKICTKNCIEIINQSNESDNSCQNCATPIEESHDIRQRENSSENVVNLKENQNIQQVEKSNVITSIGNQGIQQMQEESQNVITPRRSKRFGRRKKSLQAVVVEQVEKFVQNVETSIRTPDIQQIESNSQDIQISQQKVLTPIECGNIQQMEASHKNVVTEIERPDIRQIENSNQDLTTIGSQDIQLMHNSDENITPLESQNIQQIKNLFPKVEASIQNQGIQQIENSSPNVVTLIDSLDVQQIKKSNDRDVAKFSRTAEQKEKSSQNFINPMGSHDTETENVLSQMEGLNIQQMANSTQNDVMSTESRGVQAVGSIDRQNIQKFDDSSQNVTKDVQQMKDSGQMDHNPAENHDQYIIKNPNIRQIGNSSQNDVAKIKSSNIQEKKESSQNVVTLKKCEDIQQVANMPQNVMPTESRDIDQTKNSSQNVSPIRSRDIQHLKDSPKKVVTSIEFQERKDTNMMIENIQHIPCNIIEKYRKEPINNRQEKAMNITNIGNNVKQNVNDDDSIILLLNVSPDHNNTISVDDAFRSKTSHKDLMTNGKSHNNNQLSPLSNISNGQVKIILHNAESYENEKNKPNSETCNNKTTPVTSKTDNMTEINKSPKSQNLENEDKSSKTISCNKESQNFEKKTLKSHRHKNIKIDKSELKTQNCPEVLASGKKITSKKCTNPNSSINTFNRNIRKYFQSMESKSKPSLKNIDVIDKERHEEFPKEPESNTCMNEPKIEIIKTGANATNRVNNSETDVTSYIKVDDQISIIEEDNLVIDVKTSTVKEETLIMDNKTSMVENENLETCNGSSKFKRENIIISNETTNVKNLTSNLTSRVAEGLEEQQNMQTEFSNVKQNCPYTQDIYNTLIDELSPDGLLQFINREELMEIFTKISTGGGVRIVFQEVLSTPTCTKADLPENVIRDLDFIHEKLLQIQNLADTLENNGGDAVNCDINSSCDNPSKDVDTPMEIDDITEEDGADIRVLKDSFRPYVLDAWMISINGMREIYKSMRAKRFNSINTKKFNLNPLRYLTNALKNANQVPAVPTLTSNIQFINEDLLEVFYSSKASITLK